MDAAQQIHSKNLAKPSVFPSAIPSLQETTKIHSLLSELQMKQGITSTTFHSAVGFFFLYGPGWAEGVIVTTVHTDREWRGWMK